MKKLLILMTLFAIKSGTTLVAQTINIQNTSSCAGATLTFNVQTYDSPSGCGATAVSQSYGPGTGMSMAEDIYDFNIPGGSNNPLYWTSTSTVIGSHAAWVGCQVSWPGVGNGAVGTTNPGAPGSCFGGFPQTVTIGSGSLGCPSGVTITWTENSSTHDVVIQAN